MDRVEDLIQRKKCIHSLEGEKVTIVQNNLQRMNAMDRIEFLLDKGSFIEIGAFKNESTSSVITGYGTLDGRLVYIYSENYGLKGGVMTSKNAEKISNIMKMALKMGAPLIKIHDSVGADIKEGIHILNSYSSIIKLSASLSGVVPQISVISGPCTGMSAINAAMSDFTIIVENQGQFYVNSAESLSKGEKKFIDYPMYAEADNSSKNGSIQLIAKDEEEALSLSKKILTYLPSNNMEVSTDITPEIKVQPITRFNEMCNERKFDAYEILNLLSDENSIIEFDKHNGNGVVTALCKIHGLTIGCIITDSQSHEGNINLNSINKITKFARLCNSFNISLVNIVDAKGFEVNLRAENSGLALEIAKMAYTLSEVLCPKITLIIGDAIGAVYSLLCSKEASADVVYAWPSALVSPIEPEKIVRNLYKEQILNSEQPKEEERQLVEKYILEEASPYKAASLGDIDDIITPEETKIRLFMALDMLQSKREVKYPKKHGTILI